MRLIAERLLSSKDEGRTYIKGELAYKQVTLARPTSGHRYHVYCSPHNAGGFELIKELSATLEAKLETAGSCQSRGSSRQTRLESSRVRASASRATLGMSRATRGSASEQGQGLVEMTQSLDELAESDHMLVYLTSRTWTSGDASIALAADIHQAMDLGVHLLLVHEMPGLGGQEQRYAVDFGAFFSSPPDGTPNELLQRGIYAKIAVAMKGGAWREASMVLLVQGFSSSNHSSADNSNRAAEWKRAAGKPHRFHPKKMLPAPHELSAAATPCESPILFSGARVTPSRAQAEVSSPDRAPVSSSGVAPMPRSDPVAPHALNA